MTVVGILGYGDRCPSAQALQLLAANSCVENLLIFWNQPGANVKRTLDELIEIIPGITIAVSQDNLGSAGGYARIMEIFRDKYLTPYLLLLDDDLQLAPNCIENLIAAAGNDSVVLGESLLLANRPGIPELADLINNGNGIPSPRPGCCVGFHFLNLYKPLRTVARQLDDTGFFRLDVAPWGGLLIPRAALPRLGLPREDFFLYAEDTELTYRFTQNGGQIFLVPNAEITDTEPAWNTVGGNISNLRRRVLLLPKIKVFHEVRNRNYMARHYYPGFLPIYWINKFLFLASAYFMGVSNGKFSRARLIHRAINGGEIMAAKEVSQK